MTVTVAVASATVGVTVMLVTEFTTLVLYAVVADANAGLNVPELIAIALKSALEDKTALVTIKVYVFAVPSSAVTTMFMVLLPALNAIAPLA